MINAPQIESPAQGDMLEEHKQLEKSTRLHWFHWFVVIGSLILTLTAWYITKQQQEEKVSTRFEQQASQVVELVQERMEKYEDKLWSGVAAIHSQSHGIDTVEWKRFADTLQIDAKYPGINGIGVIFHVLPSEREMFVKRERVFRPNFKIHPPHQKKEYLPITFIEPIENNMQALGLDMAHETNRFTAAKKARDTGKPQITGPIVLVQDAEKTPGFLFYVPYYERDKKIDTVEQKQENFVGLVYAPFIMHKLMRGVLDKEKRQVSIKISDGSELLYDENTAANSDFDGKPLFQKVVELPFYGRPWKFEIQSTKAFRNAAQHNQHWIILFGGLFIDALLLSLFWLLTRSNRHAMELAASISEQYQHQAKDSEESRAFLDLIMENVPSAVFVKDENYKIIQANTDFINFYPEEKRDKVVGYTTLEEYPKEEADKFLELDRKAFQEGYSEVVESVLFPDGVRRILFTQKIRFENVDRKPFILGVAQDVTEREKLIERLKLSNEELERFAYVASHDLKAPLRAIDNLSQWIEEDLQFAMTDDSRENMLLLRQRVKRMDKLLDDLLEYSRITRKIKTVEPEKVAGKELLENVITLITPPEDYKITASKAFNQLEANRLPLQQVIYNLVSNAVKHHGGNKAKITVDKKDFNDLFHEISVSDDGKGIAEEFHNKVFDMFQTLESRDKVEGSGMGLALVSKIVQTLGGSVRLESQEGKGSTFYFTWPKLSSSEQEEEE